MHRLVCGFVVDQDFSLHTFKRPLKQLFNSYEMDHMVCVGLLSHIAKVFMARAKGVIEDSIKSWINSKKKNLQNV